MPLVECPSCGLPRATAGADAESCPVCQWRSEPVAPPAAEEPPPAPAPQPEPARHSPWLLAAFATAGLLVGIVATLLALRTDPPPQPEEVATPEPVTLPDPPTPPPPATPRPRPAPPRAPELVLGVPMLIPIPIPVTPPPGPTVIRLDRPDEEYYFPRVGDGNHIKFVGRVRDLHIGRIDGGSTVDASELVTRHFVVTGKIDENSTLLATKVGGNVSFRGKIDGGSRVVIGAGKAYVSFTDYSTKDENGAKILGGSQVTITAQSVSLGGTVSGKGTVVDLTLTPSGSLRFTALDDMAVLRYRTEHRADPMPRVTQGKVTGGAELKAEPTP